MSMMRFSKFVTQAKIEEAIHTSGYAQTASGKNIGAASSQSFEDRMRMEQQRKNIQAYNHSRIANQGVARSKRAVTPQEIAQVEAKDYLNDIKNKQIKPDKNTTATPTNSVTPQKRTLYEPAPRKRN